MAIYLDNSATTRVLPEVADRIREIMLTEYGNPSSMHTMGVEAERIVRESAETLASILKCKRSNIYFTSGGTESDNLAIIGGAQAMKRKGNHLITTQIEHPAVLQTMKHLESEGFEVTYLGVDESGQIRLSDLEAALREDTILVSIMHTNNEIGSLQPIAEAGELIKAKAPHALFHVDAVQGFGKARINPGRMHIDLMSVSSHKIHGPKGEGLLYVGDGVRLVPINYGGGQQGGLRSGTENVPGIAGMAMAARSLYDHLDEDLERLYELKSYFVTEVEKIEGCHVNGLVRNADAPAVPDSIRSTAPHIISVSFEGVRSEVLLHALEDKGIYCSAGSACSTHKPAPSATLTALGLPSDLIGSTLRFSMSVETTREELDETLEAIAAILPALRIFKKR